MVRLKFIVCQTLRNHTGQFPDLRTTFSVLARRDGFQGGPRADLDQGPGSYRAQFVVVRSPGEAWPPEDPDQGVGRRFVLQLAESSRCGNASAEARTQQTVGLQGLQEMLGGLRSRAVSQMVTISWCTWVGAVSPKLAN